MGYGSIPETWEHFSTTLGLTADMLPVVSRPDAEISPNSTMQKVGKTPSQYNGNRQAAGFPKWTQFSATQNDISRWRREPDYGICLQCRTVRAIDIDVADPDKAQAIAQLVGRYAPLPRRSRSGTGKTLFAFRMQPPEDQPWVKRVIPVDGGIVEWLGDGQQFIADGQHEDGNRYDWGETLPEEFPELAFSDVLKLWDAMVALFASGEPRIAKERRARGEITLERSDERADWLIANWDVHSSGANGELFLRCPFEHEHSSDTGPTSTAYFPAGTGGFEQGHWKCLHAHCESRPDAEFDERSGYRYSGLASIPTAAPEQPDSDEEDFGPAPSLSRADSGLYSANRSNLARFLQYPPLCDMKISYDSFLDQIVWSPRSHPKGKEQWRAFSDEHYMDLMIEAEMQGFESFGQEAMRLGVLHTAKLRAMDSAQIWLSRQTWDGVARIDEFLPRYFGTVNTPYTRAVSAYAWTAHAGRVITPGVQADMAPVLIGLQGERKTTAIKAISPSEDFYAEINLKARDDDLSRKLRGKLVGELEELRGLNSWESEDIKAWITRTHEEWIPKYREFGSKFARRLVLWGSGNRKGFLADPTGERRWLPMMAGVSGSVDPEGIRAVRSQLWAEGAVRYLENGVEWQDAERLAKGVHSEFKVTDIWADPIKNWAYDKGMGDFAPAGIGFTTAQALSGIGISVSQANKTAEMRMERVLDGLGFTQNGERWVNLEALPPALR